jgi:methyl-accepting chemotaxis protein
MVTINKNQEQVMKDGKKRMAVISLITGEKKFLINKNFQIQFMISLLIISICSMSVIYLANDYFFHSYMQRGEALNLPPDHPFFLMIHEQKKFMTNVFMVVAVTISAMAGLWGLFFSHKIAGPLYRLQRYFTQAAIDNTPLNKKVYFRDNDFFQEVPDSINKYIDSMKATTNEDEVIDNDTDAA